MKTIRLGNFTVVLSQRLIHCSKERFSTAKGLGVTARLGRLGAPQPHQTVKQFLREPPFVLLRGKVPHQALYFLACVGFAQRHEEIRRAQISVVFRDFVFEDEVIAKSVPRQLAYQTVVLVKIMPAMRKDYIRPEDFLEFLEAFFDWRAEVGKDSISEGFQDYRFVSCAA